MKSIEILRKERKNRINASEKDVRGIVNALLSELSSYTEMQAELWDRGWHEVKFIKTSGNPEIEADIILEDDIEYGKVKRVVFNAKIRWDGGDNFHYNVETVAGTVFFVVNGLEYHTEINGLN